MKLFDLTHPFTIHTPGWVGYPSPKLSSFQRIATQGDILLYRTRYHRVVGGEASPCRVVAFVDEP